MGIRLSTWGAVGALCGAGALAGCGATVAVAPSGEGGAPATSTSTSSTSSSGSGLTQLATLESPFGIALDDDWVYVTAFGFSPGTGKVVKLPKNGGAPVELVTGISEPTFIALDDTRVYFTHGWTDDQLASVSKQGGPVETILISSVSTPCSGIAADAKRVYCVEYSSAGTIKAFDKGSTVPVEIGAAGPYPHGLVVDDDSFYWLLEGSGDVHKMPKNGGPTTVFASLGTAGIWRLEQDANNIYWSAVVSQPSPFVSGVRSVPKSGGPVTLLAEEPQEWMILVGVDDNNVYWATDSGDSGAVKSAPKTGGSVDVIATEQLGVRWGAADASGVYWAAGTTGAVMRFVE